MTGTRGFVFGLLLAAGACTDAPAARSHTVLLAGFAFAPPGLTAAVGDTVIFRNSDFVAHTATEGGGFDSGEIAQGEEWRWVATAGSHEYLCTLHPSMKGSIVVE